MAVHINNINSLKGLALCHLNCRSLYYKLDEIKVLYDRFDFMGFSESWLDSGINDQGRIQDLWKGGAQRRSRLKTLFGISKGGGAQGACALFGPP